MQRPATRDIEETMKRGSLLSSVERGIYETMKPTTCSKFGTLLLGFVISLFSTINAPVNCGSFYDICDDTPVNPASVDELIGQSELWEHPVVSLTVIHPKYQSKAKCGNVILAVRSATVSPERHLAMNVSPLVLVHHPTVGV